MRWVIAIVGIAVCWTIIFFPTGRRLDYLRASYIRSDKQFYTNLVKWIPVLPITVLALLFTRAPGAALAVGVLTITVIHLIDGSVIVRKSVELTASLVEFCNYLASYAKVAPTVEEAIQYAAKNLNGPATVAAQRLAADVEVRGITAATKEFEIAIPSETTAGIGELLRVAATIGIQWHDTINALTAQMKAVKSRADELSLRVGQILPSISGALALSLVLGIGFGVYDEKFGTWAVSAQGQIVAMVLAVLAALLVFPLVRRVKNALEA